MAISAGAAGAWAAVNATTQTVTLPTHSAGQMLLLVAACKASGPTNLDIQVTTPATGWTRLGSRADGTLASGNGTGSVTAALFYKIATSGSETNPVVTWGNGETAAPGIALAQSFSKGTDEDWVTPVYDAANTTNATSISVVVANTSLAVGDWGVVYHTTRDDSALTVPSWTAATVTLSAVTEYPATAIASATSNDMAGDSGYRSVTAGSVTGNITATGTQAAAETGVSSWVKLRVTGNRTVTPPTATLTTATFAPRITNSAYAAAVIADSPLVYWRLGESSGTVAVAEVGPNGDYFNTPTLGVASLLVSDANTSVTFASASTEYAYANGTMPVGSSAGVTVEAWIRFGSLTAFTYYGMARWWHLTPVSNDRASLYYNTGPGVLEFNFYDGTATRLISSDAWSPSTATTYHIVASLDPVADTVSFYVNGALLSSEDISAHGPFDPAPVSGYFTVARTGGEYFDGTMDEVALYNSPLSSTQVAHHYAVATAAGATATPTTVALTLATFAPTVTTPQTVTPTTAALTLATFAPVLKLVVTPTTAAVVLAAFAPTVTATANQLLTPTTAALVTATFAPVVKLVVTPTTVALVTATFAPTVTASNHQTATPTTAALTTSTFAPTVTATAHQLVTPTTATLTTATFAPVLKLVVTPSTASLTTATFAPVLKLVVIPSTAAVVLTTFAPAVSATAHVTATPTTVSLTTATFAPTVTTPQTVTPSTAALTLTTFAPTVSAPRLATPTTASLTLATFAPVVSATAHVTATPSTAALVTATFAPTVSATANQLVTPATLALTLAPDPPIVTTGGNVQFMPDAAALTLTTFAPTVSAIGSVNIVPTTASLTLATFAPTVTAVANVTATPTTKALTLTAYAPVIRLAITPTTASLSTSTFAPSISVSNNAFVIPGTAALVLTTYAPDAVGVAPLIFTPGTASLVLAGYAPLVFEAGPIDFIDGELAVADPVRGVLVVTSPHHGASVGANGRGRTTLVVTTPYIKGDVESN